ncbi:5'/3'-nucleotidase SurE [Verrucomicrobiota bacterium]
MPPPLIFVSNDDGVDSPGLHAAVDALLPLGSVTVAAPRHQQSGAGRGLVGDPGERLHRVEYRVRETPVRAYSCNASPAQTVLHALDVLCSDTLPDLFVAGINYGENLGLNVTLSGTIGAAMEAASRGIPSLAVSLETDHAFHFSHGEVDWGVGIHFTREFAAGILSRRMPADVDVINVVIPDSATPDTPWRTTRASRQSYFATRLSDPSEASRIRDAEFGVYVDRDKLEPDSDIRAVLQDRVVSVTPLSLDMTSRTGLDEVDTILRGPK